MNGDDVPDVTAYANARGVSIDEIRGVIIVGGDAAGTCDGFGFVSLTADPFETLISQIALAIAILALIALLIAIFTGREAAAATATAGSSMAASSSESTADEVTATGAGTAAGLAAADNEQGPDPGQELIDDINDAAEESGFGKHEE